MEAAPETTPDPSRERLAVLAVTVAAFGIALNAQIVGPLGPFLRDALALEDGQIGDLVAVGWWATALSSLALLPIVDRVGRRAPIFWGTVVFGLASAGHLFVSDLDVLLVVRALSGFAGGVVFTVASAAIADLVPYERRGAAMGTFNLSLFLAPPLGGSAGVLLAQHVDWRAIFVVQTVATGVALLGLWRHMPADLAKVGRGSDGGAGLPRGGVQWGVLRMPHVAAALVAVMLYAGAFATVTQFLGVWLDADEIVLKSSQWSIWLSLGLISALGTVALTRYADRWGKRPFVVGTSLVVGLGLAALTSVSAVGWLIALGVPIAACTAARSGAMVALVSGLAPAEQRGSLMVLRSVAVNVGMGSMVWLGGLVVERFDYAHLFWFAAAAVLVSAVLVVVSVREGDA